MATNPNLDGNKKLTQASMDFAVKIVALAKTLQGDAPLNALSAQLLRTGTTVGAIIHTLGNSVNKGDFVGKLHLGLKNCQECQYWIDLLKKSDYLTDEAAKECVEICGFLTRSLMASIEASKKAPAPNDAPITPPVSSIYGGPVS